MEIDITNDSINEEEIYFRFNEYQPNGQLLSTYNYSNGLFISYHENGLPNVICSYLDGKIHGFFQSYHSNGVISKNNYYINGIIHGVSTSYYPNGGLHMWSSHVDGKLEGQYQIFDSEGNINFTCNYLDGKLNGPVLIYNGGYHTIAYKIYINDQLIQTVI